MNNIKLFKTLGTIVLTIMLSNNFLQANSFSENEQVVAELFIAAYGRVSAKTVLTFYSNLLTYGSRTEDSIRDEMMFNTESTIRYPQGQSSEDTIIQVFNNVLNRDPSTQIGLDWWINRLDSGGLSMSNLVGEVLTAARGAGGGDKAQLDNKLAAAEYFLANTYATTKPDLATLDETDASLQAIKDAINIEVIAAGETPEVVVDNPIIIYR